MLNNIQTDEANRIFTIRKLFTEGYYNYRFSSLFISTIEKMSKMTIPVVTKFTYNDIDKYIEIECDSNEFTVREASDGLLSATVNILSGFLRFCYEDKIMRDILYSVNPDDFKVFDSYMKPIYEYEASTGDHMVAGLRISGLVHNIFKITPFYENLIRINLI